LKLNEYSCYVILFCNLGELIIKKTHGTQTFTKRGSTVKKNILTVISILGICMAFAPFAWADDDPQIAGMRSACDKGNSTACFRMGERYRIVEQDNKAALKFYIKACDADYMTGCTNGGILLTMQGTQYSKQWKGAKKMFQKACDAGEDRSCFNLGTINYKEGRQKKAIKFYHQACEMGNQGGCAKEKRLKR